MNRAQAEAMLATVRRAARKLRNPTHQDFDDLVQVGCEAVCEKWGDLEDESHVYREAWTEMVNYLEHEETVILEEPVVVLPEPEETKKRKNTRPTDREMSTLLVDAIRSGCTGRERILIDAILDGATQAEAARQAFMTRDEAQTRLKKIGAQFLSRPALGGGSDEAATTTETRESMDAADDRHLAELLADACYRAGR